ncbi:MAG: serine/threonine-protein kinase RIO2 [Halobacteriales archaeon]
MVQNVAPLVAELEPEDVHLLSGLEHGMRFGEWVDRDRLPELANLTPREVDYRLERTIKRKLIEKRTLQYEGYRLTFAGYDVLALWTFAQRDTIDGVGAQLGVGKESDVYEARSYRPMVLKFHREGIGNFRNLDREREYTADRQHTSDLYTARIAAEREFEVLEALYPDVAVPRPVDHNRHAIVMEKIDGIELSRATLEDHEVGPVLRGLLRQVERVHDAGFVHGDLSEYNVFVTPDRVVLFDWPQAVSIDHPNAGDLLERDLETTLAFFRRKYPGDVPEDLDSRGLAGALLDGELGAHLEALRAETG